MRWWKQFREDYDRPGMQLGIERFGTGFVHDVGRVWQFLCVEDGPGLREIVLDEMLGVLARQFRVPSEEALARIEFMASVNLIDIGTRRGSDVRLISSKELKNRRDEWSRKVQKVKGKSKPKDYVATPESRRSNSGTEADAEAKGKRQTDSDVEFECEDDGEKENQALDECFEGFDLPPGKKLTINADLFQSLAIDRSRLDERGVKALQALDDTWGKSWKRIKAGEIDLFWWLNMAMDQMKKSKILYPAILERRAHELNDRRIVGWK